MDMKEKIQTVLRTHWADYRRICINPHQGTDTAVMCRDRQAILERATRDHCIGLGVTDEDLRVHAIAQYAASVTRFGLPSSGHDIKYRVHTRLPDIYGAETVREEDRLDRAAASGGTG